jgi:DNA-binding response OmpR family regulator
VHRNGYILLVESDDLIRELLQRWLEDAGYNVAIGDYGESAVRDELPRLVIANIASPRGADHLIHTLRSVYAAPVLALSARFRRGLGASADVARRLGVKHVLPIPCSREELLSAVGDATGESSS